MHLYLVRHAIAENRDGTRWPDDSARPLSGEGAERFTLAARGLERLVPTVDLVLSSPYARAWQTAVILHEVAKWPAAEQCPPLAAARPAGAPLDPLAELTAGSVALVGHEPNLSSLASLLLTGDAGTVRLELKKGGVIAFGFHGAPAPGQAILRWAASPKILRGLAAGAA